MAKTIIVKPLGLVLCKAGLVSSEQVETALKESSILPKYRIGEILAIRGLIKPQTADFFAEIWPDILMTKKQQPLGQYLQEASLINEQQIARVLKIQSHNSTKKFGKIVVEQGLISQATLDFFLDHLNLIQKEEVINICSESVALELERIESYLLNNQKCEPAKLLQKYNKLGKQGAVIPKGDLLERELLASGIAIVERNLIKIAKPIYLETFDKDWVEKELANLQPYNQIRLKMFNLEKKAELPYKIINVVNKWTNHQPYLTQKLYQLIQEKANYITPGEEENVVEELTYQYIIHNWSKGIAAKHFQAICDRIRQNEYCSPKDLLISYKKVWQLKEVNVDKSIKQRELLNIGLVKLDRNRIKVSNQIYEAVFDLQWIEEKLRLMNQFKNSNRAKSVTVNLPTLPEISVSKSKSRKKILQIVAIITSLIAIPFFFKLFDQRSQYNEIIEQKNSSFQ